MRDAAFGPIAPAARWRWAAGASLALLVVPLVGWLALSPSVERRHPAIDAHAAGSLPESGASRRDGSEAPREPRAQKTPAGDARAPLPEPQPGTSKSAVNGIVFDSEGAPVSDATVSCAELDRDVAAVETGPDGRFHLPSEAVGCHGVARHPKLGRSADVLLAAGDGNSLRFATGGGVEGMVVGDEGTPIPSFWLAVDSFVPEDGSAPGAGDWQRFFSSTEPPGSFAWSGLPPGRYVFVATVDGQGSTTSTPIEVRAAAMTRDLRFVVQKGESLHGRVVNSVTRAPIASAMIAIWSEKALGRGFQQTASARSNGAFELAATPRSRFSIRIVADDYESKVFTDVVSEGSDRTPVVFALTPEAHK